MKTSQLIGIASVFMAMCVSCAQNGSAQAPATVGVPPAEGLGEPLTPAAKRDEAPSNAPAPTLRYPLSETPWLGVELRTAKAPDAGVEITRVLSGSPAESAKLRSGDRLLRFGDVPVETPEGVSSWVRAQAPGSTHPITIIRDGKARLLRAELQGMPEFEDRLRLALVNKKAPEILGVTTFQGEASSLADLRGRVVILEFWASYCGVCRYLAPRLDTWHRTYKPQGAEVVGITVDPPRLGLEVAARTGMSYHLASDPGGRVSHLYFASQIPLVVIIDRTGIVRDAMVGYSKIRIEETQALIETLIAQGN